MTAEVEQEIEAPPELVSPWRLASPRARHRRRRLLIAVVVIFTLITAKFGVPEGREWLTFWMLLTLLAACGGDFGVWRRAVVRDWLPLLAVLFAYDLLRGVANEVGGSLFGLPYLQSNPNNAVSTVQAHLFFPIDIDKFLFFGHVPTLVLQKHFFHPGHPHIWDRIGMCIYLSHFLVSLILAIVLWCVNYQLFRRYIAALVGLTVTVLITYVLFPMAPPWMAGLNNAFGPNHHVHRVVQETLTTIGGSTVDSAVEKGQAYSNSVAAMPSLHAAIPMMLLVFFWPEVTKRGKLGLSLYVAGMALTLVYGGEHYVTDVVAGWLYAITVVTVLRRFEKRRSNRPAPAPVLTT